MSKAKITAPNEAETNREASVLERSLLVFSWLIAFLLVGCAAYMGWRVWSGRSTNTAAVPAVVAQAARPDAKPTDIPAEFTAALPELKKSGSLQAISRVTDLHTTIPERPNEDVRSYTVSKGDSIFAISTNFKVKPETVLWANYTQLNDNPDMISVGMTLNIPPVDGVYYQWQEGDSIEAVAGRFGASSEDILTWPANQIDLVDPKIDPGAWILVPGGHREFKQWIIPTITRGKRSGVSASVYGGGACEGGYDGAMGSGNFIYPVANHFTSGNDYWSGHLGIDLAASDGMAVVASDSGVVVFAGWANGGYGYMVMLDHGNGYQTLYAHLSAVYAGCGQSVGQGTAIGGAGSTGNSTGTHLHFEVRLDGGFVDPWYVLPPQ